MSARRVAIAASEILGMPGTGGAATADSLLALALARHGHDVELIVAPGRDVAPLAAPWAELYAQTGVRVTRLRPRRSVRPAYLLPTAAVFDAVYDSSPDLLIADDWRGLAWASVRARALGIGLQRTAAIVYCHGPARMLAEFARKVPDTLPRFGEEIAERAALELADWAVSPSAWLFEWQRARGWPTPRSACVVPCLWRSVALGEPAVQAETGVPIRRLAFFGQLREGKGVRLFLESLRVLGPALDGLEVVFLGRETPRWTAALVQASLPEDTRKRLAALRFETGLDPTAALGELRAPGTLAVMPSLLDNSPYTVSECLEHGIPFVAAGTGGIPELVAERDRERVLFEPTSAGLVRILRAALEAPCGVLPAAPGFDPQRALSAWLELVAAVEPTPRRAPVRRIDAVSVVGSPRTAGTGRIRARGVAVEHVAAETRAAGLARTTHDWLLFLDEDDEPDEDLLEALVDAQQMTGADVVTTAVRPAEAPDSIYLFLGDPGALGLVENQYGVVALVRRAFLREDDLAIDTVDPDWPLLAAIALRGGRIVSLPVARSTYHGRPGAISDVPGDGLAVLRLFETSRTNVRGMEALAGTLAAALARSAAPSSREPEREKVLRRATSALRRDGAYGVVERLRRGHRRR